MSQYEYDQSWGTEPVRKVDAGKLWAGGLATALVAAGVGVAGVLAIRGLLKIAILSGRGQLVNEAIITVPLAAAAAALIATALLHLLMISTPRPSLFFNSLSAVILVVLVLLVFLANAGDLPDKVATSALYLVIGLVIMGLLTGVARTATRVVPPAPYTPPAGGQGSRPDQTQVMPPQPGYDQYGQRGPDRRDYY
jgi:hypothetical protein